jgi:hypothetical protein
VERFEMILSPAREAGKKSGRQGFEKAVGSFH